MNYTKYDIQCHMVFNATMVTFLMNKWTSIAIDDGQVQPLGKPYLHLSPTHDETLSWMIEHMDE